MGYHHLAIWGYTPLSNTPRCEEIASVQASSNRNDNAKHMSLKMFTRTRAFGCRHHGCYWYCGNSSWIADYLPTHPPTYLHLHLHLHLSCGDQQNVNSAFTGTGIQSDSMFSSACETAAPCWGRDSLLAPAHTPDAPAAWAYPRSHKHRRPSEICLPISPVFQCLRTLNYFKHSASVISTTYCHYCIVNHSNSEQDSNLSHEK